MTENGIIPILRSPETYDHAETNQGKMCAQMEKNTDHVNMAGVRREIMFPFHVAGIGRSLSNPPKKFLLSISAVFSRRKNIKAMFTSQIPDRTGEVTT